ncbi:response regulator transcription factor [Pseudomonas sp. Q1]|uniref:response regulator transcription factor n=1 Tax=Pseudomonas sp. Q1 TaxID=2202823 RepID=UPI001374D941|nr:response regulator transcription factor [Pseudomonas sp. Q1]
MRRQFITLPEQEQPFEAVANAEKALRQVAQSYHNLALIGIGLPGMIGLELIDRLRPAASVF